MDNIIYCLGCGLKVKESLYCKNSNCIYFGVYKVGIIQNFNEQEIKYLSDNIILL